MQTKFFKLFSHLYIDADGAYLRIVEVAYDKMPQGSVVMAHNSVNMAGQLKSYLDFVRDSANFHSSVNVIFDIEGLEVSVKASAELSERLNENSVFAFFHKASQLVFQILKGFPWCVCKMKEF